MFSSKPPTWAALFLFVHSALTQSSSSVTSLGTASCNKGSPLTTFSACNWLYAQITYCGSPPVATGAPFVSCYCNQQVFNAIYDCESEWRLCLENDDFDGDAQEDVSLWNSACDAQITFSPTTPVLSTVTATYDDQYCTTAAAACDRDKTALEACSISYLGQDATKYSSCFCAPPVLSDAYTCGFLGNVSCRQVPATLTNLVEYTYCDNFMSVLGGAESGSTPSSVSASSTGSSSSASLLSSAGSSVSSPNSLTITTPALPGSSSATSVPSTTSSVASSDAGRVQVRVWTWLGFLTLISAMILRG